MAGDAARLREKLLALGGVASSLQLRGLDALGELPGNRLVEEIVRELLDLLFAQVEIRHRGIGIDRARSAQPAPEPESSRLHRERRQRGRLRAETFLSPN